MKNDKNYRTEWKYICNNTDLDVIALKLKEIMHIDSNSDNDGKYTISSLYFDDYNNSCIYDNDSGLGNRFKWRIRYYNGDTSFIHLEKKEKHNGLCYKRSCKISYEDYNKIINADVYDLVYKTNEQLLKEFCLDIINRLFRPKIIIDYERIAFVEPTTNIRITIDKNITASLEIDKFLIGNYIKYPIQKINEHVLEVKFDSILPSYIQKAISNSRLNRSTFSKYYLGRVMSERNYL